MIALQFLSLVFGVALVLAVLGSALETVVLPQEGFSRLSQAVFATTYGLLVHRRNSVQARSLRSLYAPVSLVSLPLVWMIVTVIAFTFVFWGTGNVAFQRAFEHSASSLTTLGFSEPSGTGKIVIAFVEATIGLGLVALLISFLPTIYTAYNGREKGINRLRPVAGAPPNATQLLQTLRRIGAFEGIDFWRSQADWLLDLEQTHTAFPFLTYFPETHTDHSWVATVGSLLDSAALVVATTDDEGDEVYQDAEKGPIMVVVYGLPLIVRIARAANVPLPPFQGLPDLSARAAASAPEIAVTARRVRRRTGRLGYRPRGTAGPPRGGVAPVLPPPVRLRAGAPRPGWPHRRLARSLDHGPSRRRRPTALPAPPAAPRGLVDVAAGAGTDRRRPRYRWLKPPDSSLVMDTLTGWRLKWAIDSFMSCSRSPARSRLTPWRTRIRWTEMSETEPVKG